MTYWKKCLDDKDDELRQLQTKLDTMQTTLREESVSNAESKTKLESQLSEHEHAIQLLKLEHQQQITIDGPTVVTSPSSIPSIFK